MKTIAVMFMSILIVLAGLQFSFAEEDVLETEDQFIDNRNEWEVFNSTMAKAIVDGGQYYIENKSVGGELFVLHHGDFPLGKEFILETSIKALAQTRNSAYGFIIGASDASNGYVFQVLPDKSYAVIAMNNGNARSLAKGSIKSRTFKPEGYNSLKIEKMGDTVRFYVSDYFLEELSNIKLPGKKIGFFINGKTEIAVDYTRSTIWLE